MDAKTLQEIENLVRLKLQVREQQEARNNTQVDDVTLQKDLDETRNELTTADVVPIEEAHTLIRDMLTEVVTRSRVSQKFKRDLRNTHARVLLSLHKRCKLMGSKDLGVTLAQVKQDITPSCRQFVEPILVEGVRMGLVVVVRYHTKDYFSLNLTNYNDVQYFLNEEFRK